MSARRITHVYKALNRRRTLFGVDPGLFQLTALLSVVVLNQLGSLSGAVLMFAALIVPAQMITRKDPKMLAIVLASDKFRARYDPAKRHMRQVLVVGLDRVGESRA